MKPIERIPLPNPRRALALLVVAMAGGCGTEPPVPAAVTVSPDSPTLLWVDETVRLTATVQGLDGQAIPGAEVTWTSEDESVVTVDATGLVRAVGKGVTFVRAVAGDVEGSSMVRVNPDRRALLAIYEAMGGSNWKNNYNWGTDAPLDKWYGVTADSKGNVQALNLDRNGLAGTIPAAIGLLGALDELDLYDNQLTGPIPPELGSLTALRDMSLSSTGLTGPIPPELGNLTKLRRLMLYQTGVTGAIPPELGNLTALRYMGLRSTGLTGPIPPELGNLQALRRLYLDRNKLTGSIPPELGNLHELEYLSLAENELTGPIPPELGTHLPV